MTHKKSISLTLSAAALLSASPAMADITAAELWSLWQEQSASYGQPLTATVTETGTGLTLTDLGATVELDEDAVMVSNIPEVTMTDQGDGTVAITMSETATYRITGIDGGDEEITVVINMAGMSATASGSTDMLTVDSAMESLSVADVSFVGIPEDEIPEFDLDLTMTAFMGQTTYDFTNPESISLRGAASAGGMNFTLEAWEPQPGQGGGGGGAVPVTPQGGTGGATGGATGGNSGGFQPVQPQQPAPTTPSKQNSERGHLQMAFIMGAMETEFSSTLPLGVDWATVETYPAGMALAMEADYESLSMRFAFQDRWDAVDISIANEGGHVGFGLSEDAVHYDVSDQGLTFAVSGSELPFPIAGAADSTLVRLDVPLARADEPSPFSAAIAYEGVTVDESLWAMVDPGNMVPRSPASVVVDLSGTVQIFVDLLTMDPDQMTAPPGEIRDLTLNNLQVSFGGAELTGTGDVDFVPGQIIPNPVGEVNLSLTGANGLMDTLSNAGLLPPAQAGMARGMLGMFALPGAGSDSYTSTINFGADGSITANGVPLQ